jgi:hypothetical protein
LTWEAPFSLVDASFPPARKPAYLQRLAVVPELLRTGSLAGAQCVRKANDLALGSGADALRAEVNPDLANVAALLSMFGFLEYSRMHSEDGRLRAYLHKYLAADPAQSAVGRTAGS